MDLARHLISGVETVEKAKRLVPRYVELLAERAPYYERRYGVRYEIDFSVQKPSTDTLAVDLDNVPFRTEGTVPDISDYSQSWQVGLYP